MKKIILCVVAGFVMASPSLATVGDTIFVNTRSDPTVIGTNPLGYQNTPMVTLGGDSHYGQAWEVMTASDGDLTCADCYSTMQNFAGIGTVTLDQIPSLPAGNYHVYMNFNLANWTEKAPVGIQLGGTGVTEHGNETPGAMHYFYPQTNTGQDTKSNVEIAGNQMGSSGSSHLRFGTISPLSGQTIDLNSPDGTGTCAPNCNPIVTSNPAGNSFAQYVSLAAGNQVVLSISDGADVDSHAGGRPAHVRLYGMTFVEVIPEPASIALMGLGAAGLCLFRRRK